MMCKKYVEKMALGMVIVSVMNAARCLILILLLAITTLNLIGTQ